MYNLVINKIIKKITFSFFVFLMVFFNTQKTYAAVRVKGYFKNNGTYVAPHYRSDPDNNYYNNWSTKGNTNPYTGKEGTKTYPTANVNYYQHTCPLNSAFNSITEACVCDKGFTVDQSGTQCISYNDDCGAKFGGNTYYNHVTKSCVCSKGFLYDNLIKKCISGEQFCTNQYGKESSFFSSVLQNCSYCTGGTILTKDKKNCVCKTGYHWDKTILKCTN